MEEKELNGIKKILKNNFVDGVFHTHVSLIKPRGKFQFNRQTLEEFWELYCTFIKNNPNSKIGIAEKPQQYLPILVDIDLKVKDDIYSDILDTVTDNMQNQSLYTEKQLLTVVEVYQKTLSQIVDDISKHDLTCVVLEKKMYQQTKNDIVYFKHGFHLHFPYIFLNKIDQETQVIPRVQEYLKELALFKNLKIEDSSSVIDKVCCKVPWLLYGSRKSEEHEPYRVTKVIDSNLEKISLEKAFKNYQLFNHKEQLLSLNKSDIEYYLPRILSINSYGRSTKEIKKGIISPLKQRTKTDKKEKPEENNYKKLDFAQTLQMAKRLLSMISDFRADDRNEWMTIGWCLYSITEGDPEGLELWCEFSSRCEDKYDESVCIYEWDRMTKKDLTMATLRHYASLDNETEYKKFKNEQMEKYVTESLEGSHNDIAKALYSEYSDQFICASVASQSWYQFIGHRWEDIEKGVFLREKISGGKLIEKYIEAGKKLYEDMKNSDDKARQMLTQARHKQVNKMISNLKSSNYKDNVMKECAEVFYDQRFRQKLDADPYLIGFKNGIYDLRENKFRAGRPEDFISKCMPINYVEFSEHDDLVQDIYTFLEQVFPDKSVRKYFLDVSSDIFVGGNHEKTVHFWTGEGDNGKSVTQSLFESMLGKLSIKLNTNIITGKKPSAGSAFADLARAGGGVRQLVLEEPDSDEMINTGILKHLSGNDSFYARDLFEKGKDVKEIIPLFKLILICNKLPRIKAADKAVWNRVRVIPFESTFCRPDNPAPENYEEQLREKRFPMDKQFSKKIPSLLEPFAWVLLEHRIKIKDSVRIEPEKVRIATEIYRKQNDIYRQFIEENIVEEKDKILSLTELYNLFKEWYKQSLPGNNVPVKNEIEEYFIKVWGAYENGKRWRGYRQRTLQDDIENGDVVILSEKDLVDYSKK